MSDKDIIKDLFSEKLGNYEAKVNPELWNSIASQIGAAGAAGTAATGLSLAAKWIIGVGIAGALTVTAVLISNSSEEAQPNPAPTEESNTTASVEETNDAQTETGLPEAPEATENGRNPENTILRNREIPMDHTAGGRGGNDIPEMPVRTYTPILVPANENDRVIQQIIHRQKVEHTPDLFVKEPLLPAEIPAEDPDVNEGQQTHYSIAALPNVFTPNGDGANDRFEIESENLTNFHIVVLNAQNKVVFESHNPGFVWDGRDKFGQFVPAGNYVYYITADEFAGDKPKRYSPLLINY